jgi:GTPase SAR1 family protein
VILANDGERPLPSNIDDEQPTDIVDLLDRTVEYLGNALPLTSPIVGRIRDLRERLREERFQLAVLGQFKRGKSTFLNALLGEPLLPTGVIPLTAIPTFIAWGAAPHVRVTYRAHRPPDEFDAWGANYIRSRLFSFVAEDANPKNRLDVSRVDLFYPAPILKTGVVLIDTPGIGSSYRHNTDTAIALLPDCDAALFVISADPPITEAELTYLKLVRPKVARLLFILNKADYFEPDDLQITVEFLRKTLRQQTETESDVTIFCVSALDGLKAKGSGDSLALEASGIAGVENYLLKFLAREKLATLRTAVVMKASDLMAEAETGLSFQIRTLEMPVEDLAKRRATLEEALDRIASEGRDIRDLLAGDRRRAIEQLEIYAARLRQRGRQHLIEVLERIFERSDQGNVTTTAQEAVAAAIPEFFERELNETSQEFSRVVEEILAGHQRRIDDLVGLVRRTAADLFDVPYTASDESDRFHFGRDPYWVTQQWSGGLVDAPSSLVNRLLPQAVRHARFKARLEGQVTELVQRNVENLRWATLQGLENTFRRFAIAFDERLASAIETTHGSIKAASDMRSAASDRVSTELVKLRNTLATLTVLRAKLVKISTADVDE